MATRRAVVSTSEEKSARLDAAAAAGVIIDTPKPSDIRPAVPMRVVIKLLIFTLLMVAGPISLYFFASNYIFSGSNKNTYAGGLAAVAANFVLIAYVVSSIWEDQGDDGGSGSSKTASGKGQKKLE